MPESLADTIFVRFAALTESWHRLGPFPKWQVASGTLYQPDQTNAEATRLHWANYTVWHNEDICRGDDHAAVVASKRQIDIHNQIRNDQIEKLDALIRDAYHTGEPTAFNSETAGSIVDRMSVTSLKIYHTNELLAGGNDALRERAHLLGIQADFLGRSLDILLGDMLAGRRSFLCLKQLKLYNDPATNPLMGRAAWESDWRSGGVLK